MIKNEKKSIYKKMYKNWFKYFKILNKKYRSDEGKNKNTAKMKNAPNPKKMQN